MERKKQSFGSARGWISGKTPGSHTTDRGLGVVQQYLL